MAGPWFTVQESGADWQRLEHIWISNGVQDCEGHVEIKVELEAFNDDQTKSASCLKTGITQTIQNPLLK